jgi:hypothetical protein
VPIQGLVVPATIKSLKDSIEGPSGLATPTEGAWEAFFTVLGRACHNLYKSSPSPIGGILAVLEE